MLPRSTLEIGLDQVAGGKRNTSLWAIVLCSFWTIHLLNFRSSKATIDKVAVWVRLPSIFLEYYDREALSFIGDRIGATIKVDINTSNQLRGHYARLCVLVDLTKQLMSGFSVDEEDYYIEYEGLHLLCSNCGYYGHRHEMCPQKLVQGHMEEKSVQAKDNP